AELVAHDGALLVRKGNELHLFLADRAGQDFEQFLVNGHAPDYSKSGCAVARLRGYAVILLPRNRMKVLHLAAGNRWTGAAAPAFAEVEALRMAGADAHYAYV